MEFYVEVMCQLWKAIRQKRIELSIKQSWILQHENAPAPTSMLVHEFLVKNKTLIMSQPLYSQDLPLVDIFLLPKLKTPMKGKPFATNEEIKGRSK